MQFYIFLKNRLENNKNRFVSLKCIFICAYLHICIFANLHILCMSVKNICIKIWNLNLLVTIIRLWRLIKRINIVKCLRYLFNAVPGDPAMTLCLKVIEEMRRGKKNCHIGSECARGWCNVMNWRLFFFRTTGSPSSKSPAGGSGGPASGVAGATAAPGSGASNAGSVEPRTPTAGPQNKQLQNVKGEHPSVSPLKFILIFDAMTRISW